MSRPSQRLALTVVVAFLLIFSSLPGVASAAGLTFTDISLSAGVNLPSTLNESVAWGDYDNDGDDDLYLTVNGPNVLFRNDGAGVFTDVTATAGVGDGGFSVGTAFGDLDNDGDLDLYVVTFGGAPDLLYRNDGPVGPGGAYVLTNIAVAAGIGDLDSSRGMAFLDFDADGLLDIYVNAVGPDILYHNLGNLQFTNVAAALGVATEGTGVGVVCSDVDGNGWIDIFTGNRSGDPNRLYLNDQGVFTDMTEAAGIDKVGLGMGVMAFDHDNDLEMDLYWTSWPAVSNAFYDNQGGATFVDVAVATGTDDPTGWGISCNAGDVDLDGWEDFFVTNGFAVETTPNVLFRNAGGVSFSDETVALGGGDFDGRGVAFADFDRDGDLDLCVTGGPDDDTRLWRNDTVTGHHWLTLELEGTVSNRSAIGARIEVTTDAGTIVREVSGGAGRGSQNSLGVEFGLGLATAIQEIVIDWPSGIQQTLTGVALDQFLSVVEQSTVAVEVEASAVAPRVALGHGRPNPFNPSTKIEFSLHESGRVQLRVYDTNGRLIRRLIDGTYEAGAHDVTWDGRDDGRRLLESGAYFVRLETANEVRTRKVMLIK